MNAKMPELKHAFEAAGFTEVHTLLSSGNVVFTAGRVSVASLQAQAEAAMEKKLGKAFLTFVRPVAGLQKVLESEPYKGFGNPPGSKRIVTFLRDPPGAGLRLPLEKEGARILAIDGGVVFGDYTSHPKGPVFMALLEKAFGKAQTTRTWQTVERVVASA
jgi:uncharacterized protein (DUF1697 family)